MSIGTSHTVTCAPGEVGALADLDAAVCSDGAPSARNLLVTVFGDVLLTIGSDIEITVQALTAVLADFGVNERLVRTSLSRLVSDDLLAVRPDGRRSFYRVAPSALDLFARGDERIYRGRHVPWDGQWTLVVLDGAESTAQHRARLRQELAGLGLGTVAPNVMGSPTVAPESVADTVERLGGFDHVLVTRSALTAGDGLLGDGSLAGRCLGLDEVEQRYDELATRLSRFDESLLDAIDDRRAAKLRLLVVATFRRIVFAEPLVPEAVLPTDWSGYRARGEAARIYRSVAARADDRLRPLVGLDLRTDPARFAPSPRTKRR